VIKLSNNKSYIYIILKIKYFKKIKWLNNLEKSYDHVGEARKKNIKIDIEYKN